MPRFVVNPVPEMVSQRLVPALNFKPMIYAIDPTCGRYCLKALLKYWIEVKQHVRVSDSGLLLPRPPKPGLKSWVTLGDWVDISKWDPHWIAYDPMKDFQHADNFLVQGSKPGNIGGWKTHLENNGPTILSGPLGAASVGHYILLIGADTDNPGFIYKDPLTGDVEKEESFASMQSRIDDEIVYGDDGKMANLPAVVGNKIQL
jgi:hypothetical protein